MSVEKAVEERAVRAKMASRQLVHHSSEQRSVALCRAAELLGMRRSKIMRANAIDLEGAQSKALSAAMIDRLTIQCPVVFQFCVGVTAEIWEPINDGL